MRENRRALVGRVVSNTMDKTVVVLVESRKPHRLYHRIITRTKRFKAHDGNNQCAVGDVVRIVESRPISKDKHWQVAAIVVKGHVAEVQPTEIDANIMSS